jgi:TonB family protein
LESKEKVAPAVLAAALPADPWPPPAPVEADYGRELVARAHGRRPSRADWAPIVAGLGGRLPWALWSRMTDAEREAAQAAGFGRGGKGTGAGYQAPMRQTADAAGRPARIMRPIVADVLTEMAAITGCRLGSDADYAAALLTYRPDGRPKQVSLVKRSIPRRCTAFVSAAMTLLVARADHALVEAPTDVVFLPLQSEMLGCIDHVPLTRPLDMGETGVSMPELLREAKPKYTPDAMKSRVEGTVLLRAVVSDTGCVSHAEVLRPLHPELDLEALSAILQWKFKPARRDDRPVAVQVSVEVAFNLRR